MEAFATTGGLIPEQVWDEPDLTRSDCRMGRPTGAANPLVWAHAEYIRLLRSVRDGRVFDRVEPVVERYQGGVSRKNLEIWKFNRQIRTVRERNVLRILGLAPFHLRYTLDGWRTAEEGAARWLPRIGCGFLDIPIPSAGSGEILFTFFWTEAQRWEGRDFRVEILRE
jgi:glucoamylase